MYVILFGESQDKDIAGKIKKSDYSGDGEILEKKRAGISRRTQLG
jgi:hypothetical protein